MARARKKAEAPADDEDDAGLVARDFVMARLAAARATATNAITALDEALALFVDPQEDASGRKRKEAIGDALEEIGAATRALESAEESFEDADVEAGEPWEEDEDDDD